MKTQNTILIRRQINQHVINVFYYGELNTCQFAHNEHVGCWNIPEGPEVKIKCAACLLNAMLFGKESFNEYIRLIVRVNKHLRNPYVFKIALDDNLSNAKHFADCIK